jgi:hypothetical protein
MIKTVKELREQNVRGVSVYRLSSKFELYSTSRDGITFRDEWTTDEYFTYDGKVLTAHADGSKINPAILFKARVGLLTPKEWA